MIYIIVGGSCSGKTSFVYNSWVRGKSGSQKKTLLPYYETNSAYIFGKWNIDERTKGTDRISRKDIPKFEEQIDLLYKTGKDIVLEGDKIISRPLWNKLKEKRYTIKLYLMQTSPKISIQRNRANGSTSTDRQLTAVCSRARNIFFEFKREFDGTIINTDHVDDFANLSIRTIESIKSNDGLLKDFAIFILTHGRADNVLTANALKNCGYTGKWYIVIDNEDSQENKYREIYGEKVIQFDKKLASKSFDTMDLSEDFRTIACARNVCFDLAKKVGVRYFLELDDDYTSFYHVREKKYKLEKKIVRNFDDVCKAFIKFLSDSGAKTVCFAQAGDFICGTDNPMWRAKLHRKAMNSFFCDVENSFNFIGRINEDVNTYTHLGQIGEKFFSVAYLMLNQKETQSNKGGMTEIYLDSGTYIKSFYSVMCSPSCVTIDLMGAKNKRIHHNVHWRYCTPMILNERYKKRGD